MKTPRICKCALVVAMLFLAFGAGSVQAELIAYDQFIGYTDGQLSGQGQGFGWSGNWAGASQGEFESGGLTYSGLPSSGGNASINATGGDSWVSVSRTLATPITTNGTYYFGFLFQLPASYPKHGIVTIRDNTGTGGNYWAGLGRWNGAGTFAAIQSASYTANNSTVGINNNVAHLVLKVIFSSSGNSSVNMYVNPANAIALGGTANASIGSLKLYNIGSVGVTRVNEGGNAGSIAFDEVRIGTAAADMFEPIYRPPAGTLFTFQ